ncbi:hypothetical protein GCM10009665_73300 [Kitasatospora nipponensis]|uniref:Uncharacterized protein n=1 Tax=Kitasatospora nipponensis TaxID=258049 RepID=A0ABN1X2S6_9ACTN
MAKVCATAIDRLRASRVLSRWEARKSASTAARTSSSTTTTWIANTWPATLRSPPVHGERRRLGASSPGDDSCRLRRLPVSRPTNRAAEDRTFNRAMGPVYADCHREATGMAAAARAPPRTCPATHPDTTGAAQRAAPSGRQRQGGCRPGRGGGA